MSQLSWDVLDHWMGRQPQRLWLVFRNAEWPTYNYAAGRGESGYLGVWGNWLDLLDTDTYEQACNRTLYTIARTRAAALSSKPANTVYRVPCDSLLPVPAITPKPTAQDGADMLNRTFNRQSLVLSSTGPESEMDIVLVDGHPATGQVKDLAVTVSYLDRGTDRFYLTFPLATGATRQYIVTKTGTNLWQRASFAVPSVKLENRLAGARGPAFIVITNDNNPQQEFLHEVYADISEPAATPTPTRTATATPSRTHTPTATASRTLTPSSHPHADSDRDRHTLAHAHAYCDRFPHAHAEHHPHTDSDRNRHTLAHAHAHCDRFPHAHAERHGHAVGSADRHADANAGCHVLANNHRHRCALADGNIDRDLNTKRHACCSRNPYAHPDTHRHDARIASCLHAARPDHHSHRR